MKFPLWLLLVVMSLTVSCQGGAASVPPTLVPTIAISSLETPNALSRQPTADPSLSEQPTILPSLTLPPTNAAPPTPLLEATQTPRSTVLPTASNIPPEEAAATITPTLTIEPTATYWPTVTRQVLSAADGAGLPPCQTRMVPEDLLVFATQQFALPEFYTPPDLVLLTDYFEPDLTLGQTLYVRQSIIDPLQQLLTEMHAAGLQPSIISAYRSYGEQALAWQWWSGQYPDRLAIMSARPGYSEHQLGTTIDFGSPALNHLFHVDFANTAEGVWLSNNAHRFGFTMSYPANTYDITGIKYEPWHFRYVGPDLATLLYNSGQILTSWQIENLPFPCIP